MSRKNNSAMWEYLERCGVLENGNDEEIKAAKKSYRREYLLEHKRRQRTFLRPEFTVSFSNEKGEYERIKRASLKHQMTVTAFIRASTLAYVSKTYIVPDGGIAYIEQLLAQALNEIKTIIKEKERYFWQKEQKYEKIEKRIEKLEEDITRYLCHPLPVEEFVKKAITKNPELKDQILAIVSNDNQTIYPEKSKL